MVLIQATNNQGDFWLHREHGFRGRRLFFWIAFCALLCAAGIVALVWFNQHRPPQVKTTKVALQIMKRTTISSGTVRPVQRQVIYANQLPSAVSSLDVHAGDHVKQGQTILQLDNTQQQKAVSSAEAALAIAEQAHNRALQGFDAASAALKEVWLPQIASTQHEVQQAQEQLTGAKAQLAATTLTAKFSGTVLIATKNGLNANGNQSPIMELVGDKSQVVLAVSEVDAVHLSKGMAASITSDAFPNQTFKGTVSTVAPYAQTTNAGSGQVEVLVQLKASLPIPLGYQVSCKIVSQTHDKVPVVPYSVLVQQGTKYVVYTVRDNRLKRVSVKLGITNDNGVQVTSGLHGGDLVVVNPPHNLASGEVVRTS